MNTFDQNKHMVQVIDLQPKAWDHSDAAAYGQYCETDISFTNVVRQTFFGRQAFEEKHLEIDITGKSVYVI